MEYEIVKLEAFDILGFNIRTTNENQQAMQDIGAVWQLALANDLINKIPNKTDSDAIGLYDNYESDFTKPYDFTLGARVSSDNNAPPDLTLKKIPAATYAKFTVSGPMPDNLINAWFAIWEMDLKRTYSGDFEAYGDGMNDPDNPHMHIYIAIEG